jgi:hypothetical protein
MNEGKFHVRYLRVPLISSKLFAADCRMLVERITRFLDFKEAVICKEIVIAYLCSL